MVNRMWSSGHYDHKYTLHYVIKLFVGHMPSQLADHIPALPSVSHILHLLVIFEINVVTDLFSLNTLNHI